VLHIQNNIFFAQNLGMKKLKINWCDNRDINTLTQFDETTEISIYSLSTSRGSINFDQMNL